MMPMTRLLCLAVAGAGFATATPSQAQSRFDVCAAYARDSMMAFYSSSAVPVPRAARAWEAVSDYGHRSWGRAYTPNQAIGSLRFYFNECRARRS
jgi:hypothetical protein